MITLDYTIDQHSVYRVGQIDMNVISYSYQKTAILWKNPIFLWYEVDVKISARVEFICIIIDSDDVGNTYNLLI